MTITLVGTDTDQDTGSANLTFTEPAHLADDFAIIWVWGNGEGTAEPTFGVSGWTERFHYNQTGGDDRTLACYYKKYTSAANLNPAVTTTVSNDHSAVLHTYRGVDTTTPFDLADTGPTGIYQSTLVNPTPGGITTANDNSAVIVVLGVSRAELTAAGAPSGYTLGGSVVATDLNLSVAHLLDSGSAGAKSPGSWTNSGTAVDCDGVVVTTALRAASTGTAISLDYISREPGEKVIVTAASALSGVLSTLTTDRGDTIAPDVSPAPTTTVATYTIPAAPFTSTNMLHTLFDLAGTIYVTGGGEDSATTAFTVAAPTPKNAATNDYWFLQCSGLDVDDFSESILPSGTTSSDYFYAYVTNGVGNVNDISTSGIRDASAFPLTVVRVLWDASADSGNGEWGAASTPYVWEVESAVAGAVSVGGLAQDSTGALFVQITGADVIHQGTGIQNDGAVYYESV